MKKSLEKYLTENTHLTTLEREIILEKFNYVSISRNKLWVKSGDI
jgi:hypothetical protein